MVINSGPRFSVGFSGYCPIGVLSGNKLEGTLTAQLNKERVRRYLDEVWNQGNIEGSASYLAPGYRRHVGPGAEPLDVDGQRDRLQGFRTAFPDVKLEIEQMVAEGDLVAFRFTMTGTHLGPYQGIEPTGVRVNVPGLDLVRLKDGFLTEHWGGADLTILKAQLAAGATPPAPAAGATPPAPS
jgi:predicted ester cyclase